MKINRVIQGVLFIAVLYGGKAIYSAMKDESDEKVEAICLVYGQDSAECRNEKII